MAPPHLLQANKKSERPSNLFFFDTETRVVASTKDYDEVELQLWISCYLELDKYGRIRCETWNTGLDEETLLAEIEKYAKDKKKLYVVSSNIYFDVRVSNILKSLFNSGYQLKRGYVKGMTFIMSLRKGLKTIALLNLQNWLPCSIKSLGKMLNLPKIEVDIPNLTASELYDYCKRDVEILRAAFLKYNTFLNENDLGNFQCTLASQGFTAYRHRFMKHKIHIHKNVEATKLERSAYFGGRCEAFFLGKIDGERTLCFDINSLYPSVMKDREIPCSLYRYVKNPMLAGLKHVLKYYCVIADVTLETTRNIFPKHHDGRLTFPIGRFRTSLCTESLLSAVANEEVVAVHSMAVYYKANLFHDWVESLYAARMKFKSEGDEGFTYMVKILLNSLYGKWAQATEEKINEEVLETPTWGNEISVCYETGKKTVIHKWGSHSFEYGPEKLESYNSFTAISAHITDYGRNTLQRLIDLAGSHNVWYVDTDSLFVNEVGSDRLAGEIDPLVIGKLKFEKETNSFLIRGCKDYEFDGKRTIKGIRVEAEQLEHGIFQQVHFPGFLSGVREHLEGKYKILKIKKVLKREYKKGIMNLWGRVEPLKLKED